MLKMLFPNYFTLPFYVPRIYRLFRNWPEYLLNYVSRGNRPAEYLMRNGIRLIDGTSRQPVDCTTLRDIFESQHLEAIDLLKMNCEGAEYEILDSCSGDDFDRIANIRLEYHNLDGLRRNGKSLSRFLEVRGYKIERFTRYLNKSGFIWAVRGTVLTLFPEVLAFFPDGLVL